MEFLPQALQALNSYSQFVVYVLTPSKMRPNKMDKIPVNFRTGTIADAHDPLMWTDANTAIAAAKALGANYGIGFVFTINDPFFFLDIDDCLDPHTNQWSELAKSLLTAFNGAAVEVSSSGRGLHVIGKGTAPLHGCRNSALKLEFYTSKRFVALTGFHASGSADTDCTPVLEWLVTHYFPTEQAPIKATWTDTPCAEWRGTTDDDELIGRALKSKSGRAAFGGGASFADLWEANETQLAIAYPPNDNDTYNRSGADAGLAQHLAFWTGNDCERMRRIMLRSGLVREKWNREDYLPRTILGACGRQKEWLSDSPPESIAVPETSQAERIRPTRVTGTTFLSVDQQIDIFEGCTYVSDEHKVLVPGGNLLNPERFKVTYGGFTFAMDDTNQRTSRNAWEAFTESQAFRCPKADTTCFKPNMPPGRTIHKDGQNLVNIWWPVTTKRLRGDPSPILNHIKLLVPDPRDQLILIYYMAALVQYQGVKFHYTPLIQGVQGNGKTLLSRCIAIAVGLRYSHFPKAAEIAAKFNGWLYGRIFIGVEDIYVPDARLETIEAMKPMITNEWLEIENKGQEKITRDICANFIINTNHKDGIRKTEDDRRFAPFYTAQQSLADLKRDGMLGQYFPNLYRWLGHEGYAIFTDYLMSLEIPDEFNPTMLDRAPLTTSTTAAIEHGLGTIEQEIMEAAAQGKIGFRNGWISSTMLDRFLKELHAARRVPQNKRKELLESLGYVRHPRLNEGRTNNAVQPDSCKSVLYVREGHPALNLVSPAEIAKAYETDQTNS